MTKWKQKQIEHKQKRAAFAKVAQAQFLKLYCDKTFDIAMNQAQAKQARESLCKSAWAMADFMLDAEGRA